MGIVSENNKRIVKNTVFLYIRMLLVMFVTLYTSRAVLQVLGVTDFGIYNVVGGVVALLSFFTSSLSNITLRYINIGLGKNNLSETKDAFRQSITLMFFLSMILFILGETVGLWFVNNKLVVPQEKIEAAVWVYHFSLVSVIFSINQIPFIAVVVAHERMNMYAYLGLFEAFARLIIVYILTFLVSIDSLVLYGALTALIPVLVLVFYMMYCLNRFAECKIQLFWNKTLIKDMLRFISYNMFGCLSWSAGVIGTNILLNLFFGPIVNAARAISVQVSAVVTSFTENIMTAVKPQIIKSYAANDITYMIALIEKSSKYAYFLAAVLAIPIMMEIEFVLNLWLGNVPEHTVLFTRLALCEVLIGVFISPLWIAANATGKIKRNQVYGRLFTLAVLPISYLFLKFGADSSVPFIIAIFANLLYWIYCLYDIYIQIDLNIGNYIIHVICPSFFMTLGIILIGFGMMFLLPEHSFRRFVIGVLSYVITIPLLTYFLLTKNEQKIVLNFIRATVLKLY